jgi:predicted peroxiredoxin
MEVLYIATSGPDDPTRASIPVHLAVNGSAPVGQTVGLLLAGDATGLLKADVREAMEGVGLPAARELYAKLRDHEIPVYV